MLCGLLLLLAVVWNLVIPHPDPGVEALRRQGLPVTLPELNAWYAPVPPAENAAMICSEAFAQASFNNTTSGAAEPALDTAALPARGCKFAPENKKELIALLAKNQEELRLLYSVPAGRRSRYPVDLNQGFTTLLPHLAKVKRAMLLLTAEATLHAENGERDKAVGSLVAAGCVADSLRDEPLIISQLVRFACDGILVSRLERVINLTDLGDAQLESLQRVCQQAEHPPGLFRGMVGEQAIGISFFTNPRAQVALFRGQQAGAGAGQANRVQEMLGLSVLKTLGIFRRDKEFFMQVMATNIAAAKLPFPDRFERGQEADKSLSSRPGRFCIFSRMLLPALSRAFLKDADHTAQLRVARTALALERFRLAHNGMLPARFDELVPAYLPDPVSDPVDGQPLRFKALARGYVVWSVGSDGKDDGGRERNPKNASTSCDITFIVER